MAPLGDRGIPRRRPETWRPAALIDIFDDQSMGIGGVGNVAERSEQYLSSFVGALALGVVGDSLYGLVYSEAAVYVFAPAEQGGFSIVRRVQLPKYFEAPEIKEEVRTYPWIQYNGDMMRITSASGFGATAFGPEGRIYAVRNYSAEWHRLPRGVLAPGGEWIARRQALEIYTADGEILGAYELDGRALSWIRVSGDGRIIAGEGTSRLAIYRDPAGTLHHSCEGWPSRKSLTLFDSYRER